LRPAPPGTCGEPDQVIIRDDDRYGLMTVMSWGGGLHPKLACRGHFEGMARPPHHQVPPDPGAHEWRLVPETTRFLSYKIASDADEHQRP
jgi:hypothetical protein